MQKQDRQGVRRASDIEQKYDLSLLNELSGKTSQQNVHLSQLQQQLAQAINDLNSKIANIEYVGYPIGAVYIGVDNTNPTELFGGTWEFYTEGHLLLGMGQGEDGVSQALQLDDTCYVWKRIS